MKALRRLVGENRRQDGYVISEGDRVYFGVNTNRRRAIGIDLSKTELVSEDDFPHDDPEDTGAGFSHWGSRYGD